MDQNGMRLKLGLLLSIFLVGCATTKGVTEQTFAINQVGDYKNCGPVIHDNLIEIESDAELVELLKQFHKMQINFQPVVPETDFVQNRYFVYLLGQVANSGYGLILNKDVTIENGEAVIQIEHTKPNPDRMYAQVIQSPCVMFVLPKLNYNAVRVRSNKFD